MNSPNVNKLPDAPAALAPVSGSVAIWDALKQEDLTDDETRTLEALGFRASRAGEKEVENAVGIVLCALQGFWKKPPNDQAHAPRKEKL